MPFPARVLTLTALNKLCTWREISPNFFFNENTEICYWDGWTWQLRSSERHSFKIELRIKHMPVVRRSLVYILFLLPNERTGFVLQTQKKIRILENVVYICFIIQKCNISYLLRWKLKRWLRRWKDVRQELCSGTGEQGLQYLLQYSSLPPQSSQSASDTDDHILSCWHRPTSCPWVRVWVLALDFGLFFSATEPL